ncbi:hypothetical protein FE810_01795 [Thalassotalea litorea]|uniref:Lipoprotein n=1 Tax=Thalassotalea litorea TaxID=2020715 RepID=A0A5R9IWZ8_9GAMM|nr:hypothetical protein [Thalassotalea litorea]TLU67706.1 hypothetical protein FE810_01795 [Thalassotalea litorea]
MNKSWKNLALTSSCLLALSACGSGGETKGEDPVAEPPVITTPEPETVPIYGYYQLVTENPSQNRYLLLSETESYIWDVAKQEPSPSELMCKTGETLEHFSEQTTRQTLNFNCVGENYSLLDLVIELENTIVTFELNQSIEVEGVTYQKLTIEKELSELTGLVEGSLFDVSGGDFLTEIRNDIDTSRYIVVSPRSPSYLDVGIYTRNWENNGECLGAESYRLEDFSGVEDLGYKQKAVIPFSITRSKIDRIDLCDGKTLPQPSTLEPIYFTSFSLNDGSYVVVSEQQDFITVGRVALSE